MIKTIHKWCALLLLATLTACASHQRMAGTKISSTGSSKSSDASEVAAPLRFVQQVADQRLYQKDIVADMTFRIKAGKLDQNLSGALRMRRDEVIRLQIFIPILGSEVGRLEFAPDYVLVVDRIHHEYIKADYSKLDFLRDNGLDFYSLQSLFWNQLLLPGTQRVSEADLARFQADLSGNGATVPVTYTQGQLQFCWEADRNLSRILSAHVSYQSAKHGTSSLVWKYADFQPLGVKFFPATQSFTFTTNATGTPQQGTITLNLGRLGTDSKWDARTTLSSKYKKIEATDVFDKFILLQ